MTVRLMHPPATTTSYRTNGNGPTNAQVWLVQCVVAAYLVVSCTAPYLFGRYLAASLALGLVGALLIGLPVPLTAFAWSIGLGSLGTFGVLFGSLNGNSGALSTVSLWIVEPLLLGLLIPMAYRGERDVRRLLTTLDLALVATALLGFLLYLNNIAGLNLPITALIDPRFTGVDLSEGVLRTNFQGYNSLAFLAPYAAFRFFLGGRFAPSTPQRALVALAAVSGVILSGRQILYLEVPLAVSLVLALTRRARNDSAGVRQNNLGKRVLTVFLVAGSFVFLLQSIGLSLTSTLTRTLSQVTYQDASGVRSEESAKLLSRWLENPLFGHGAATTIKGYARDPLVPWDFELSYHVVLVTFGIFGALILMAWILWTTRSLVRSTVSGHLEHRAILGGYVGVLFASSTNPYLFKLDGIWMAFVPFAVAVSSEARRRQTA